MPSYLQICNKYRQSRAGGAGDRLQKGVLEPGFPCAHSWDPTTQDPQQVGWDLLPGASEAAGKAEIGRNSYPDPRDLLPGFGDASARSGGGLRG